MSDSKEYIGKVEAIDLLRAEFHTSRHTVEKKWNELKVLGYVHELPDPLDGRRLRIPINDLDIIRRALRGEAV